MFVRCCAGERDGVLGVQVRVRLEVEGVAVVGEFEGCCAYEACALRLFLCNGDTADTEAASVADGVDAINEGKLRPAEKREEASYALHASGSSLTYQ